jgi:hypothetical protein
MVTTKFVLDANYESIYGPITPSATKLDMTYWTKDLISLTSCHQLFTKLTIQHLKINRSV